MTNRAIFRYFYAPSVLVLSLLVSCSAPEKIKDAPLPLDGDHDKFVTTMEYANPIANQTFLRIDRNHDGVITLEEVKAADDANHKFTVLRFSEIDINRNGVITREELRMAVARDQRVRTVYGSTSQRELASLRRGNAGKLLYGGAVGIVP